MFVWKFYCTFEDFIFNDFLFHRVHRKREWCSPSYSRVWGRKITWSQDCDTSLGYRDSLNLSKQKTKNHTNKQKSTGLLSWSQDKQVLGNLQIENGAKRSLVNLPTNHCWPRTELVHDFSLKLYHVNHWIYVKAYFLIVQVFLKHFLCCHIEN